LQSSCATRADRQNRPGEVVGNGNWLAPGPGFMVHGRATEKKS